MWTVCACLLSDRSSRRRLAEAGSAHLKNIRQVTHDFVRAGEGYFSPDGEQDHLPGRGKRRATRSTRCSSWTWTTRQVPPRQPGRRQDDVRLLLARRQEDHLRQQPSRPGRQEALRRRDEPPRRRTQAPESAAAISGTSTRTWTSSRPTSTAPASSA